MSVSLTSCTGAPAAGVSSVTASTASSAVTASRSPPLPLPTTLYKQKNTRIYSLSDSNSNKDPSIEFCAFRLQICNGSWFVFRTRCSVCLVSLHKRQHWNRKALSTGRRHKSRQVFSVDPGATHSDSASSGSEDPLLPQ